MEYFGLEIFDGKPLKEVYLDDTVSLQDQPCPLTQDILCIDYILHEKMYFSVDVGWYPTSEVTPNFFFRTVIIEGPYTKGNIFFDKRSKTIAEMRSDLSDAIAVIQSFKLLKIKDIMKKKIANSIIE